MWWTTLGSGKLVAKRWLLACEQWLSCDTVLFVYLGCFGGDGVGSSCQRFLEARILTIVQRSCRLCEAETFGSLELCDLKFT